MLFLKLSLHHRLRNRLIRSLGIATALAWLVLRLIGLRLWLDHDRSWRLCHWCDRFGSDRNNGLCNWSYNWLRYWSCNWRHFRGFVRLLDHDHFLGQHFLGREARHPGKWVIAVDRLGLRLKRWGRGHACHLSRCHLGLRKLNRCHRCHQCWGWRYGMALSNGGVGGR